METSDGGIDRRFVSDYRKFLLTFNDLRDCAYSGGIDNGKRLYRFSDRQLEEFRNHPKSHYVEVERNHGVERLYRSAYTPTLADLSAHLRLGGEHTVWTCNASSADTLLMLGDIDTDSGDAQAAAEHLSREYLEGHAFIEPSTRGKGRHCYFKLSVKYAKRPDVWKIMRQFAGLIRDDPRFGEFGCRLDNVFYGLPTCWMQTEGRWELLLRGDCLKLPYCSRGRSDLASLAGLKDLPFDRLPGFLSARVTVSLPPTAADSAIGLLDTRLGAQASESTREDSRAWDMLRGSDVIRSRWGAYLYANQTLGRKATPEEACAVYEQRGAATGERTEERIRFFERIESMISAPEKRSDPNWFTDDDIALIALQLEGRVEELLAQANRRMKLKRRGALTVEDVALLAAFQRKAILSNEGYCGNKMVRGFVKARKRTHPEQKYLNAHHVREAFAILEAVGFSREIADAAYDATDKSKSVCRRFELCCAPNPVSQRPIADVATAERQIAA